MLTRTDMVKRLEAAVEASKSMRAFCRKHRLDASSVSKAARGRAGFGPKLARALGAKAVEFWVDR